MEPALVSVVIPVLNGARFIGEAIDSILAQDWRPLEIVVVDDGSTDATREVIEAATPGAATLRYAHQPPLGQGAALNHGVRIARGAMLAFLDHDDLWMPGKLRMQMQKLDADPALDAAFGYAEQFMQDEQIAARVHLPPAQRVIKAPLHSAMLIRRQALARVGPWNETRDSIVAADWYQRCQEIGLRTVMLEEVVMRRRIHGDNLSLRVARHAYFDVIRAGLARRGARSGGDPA